ncbi:MAG: MFS transporter [Enterobacteriaceae bacterium]|jgi:MFS family permease|nr:MFS transporter [Enterobacteriaceae bacterium]
MRVKPYFFANQSQTSSNWSLAFCAGLLGIGQNGLLVALPVLVEMTPLSLSVWAGLLTLGSMLFLVGSPFWGRQTEIYGSKFVVLAALSGYLLSFIIMALTVWGMAVGELSTPIGLSLLIIARIIYGLTVSGMVPACQTWALQRAGTARRMAALATISSGLSCGRLLGPMCAASVLALHPLAPLWLMAIAPLIAMLVIIKESSPPPLAQEIQQKNQLHWGITPYLLCAVLLAASVSLMQLGLAPRLSLLFGVQTAIISRHVAILLSVSAVATLLAQFLIIRPQKLTALQLLLCASVVMVSGLSLMSIQHIALFYLGCALTAFGSAMATPGYQLLLNERFSTGKSAGFISTSHTLGYGMSALAVPVIAAWYGESQLIMASLASAVLLGAIAGCLWHFSHRRISNKM